VIEGWPPGEATVRARERGNPAARAAATRGPARWTTSRTNALVALTLVLPHRAVPVDEEVVRDVNHPWRRRCGRIDVALTIPTRAAEPLADVAVGRRRGDGDCLRVVPECGTRNEASLTSVNGALSWILRAGSLPPGISDQLAVEVPCRLTGVERPS
jgi:hypothetical protein